MASPAFRTRRRHPLRTLLITVIVLLGVLVAADRISVRVADSAAASTLQRSEHLTDRPSVAIGGFPFLTQLASATFGQIRVTIRGLVVGQAPITVRVARLDVTLHRVHVSRDLSGGRADSGAATATISYSDLSTALGAHMSYAGDGRIRATETATVLGAALTATATAAPQVEAGALSFNNPVVTVAGQQVPAAVTEFFTAVYATRFPLSGLPFGVQVRAVHAGSGGVVIVLTATDLTFHR